MGVGCCDLARIDGADEAVPMSGCDVHSMGTNALSTCLLWQEHPLWYQRSHKSSLLPVRVIQVLYPLVQCNVIRGFWANDMLQAPILQPKCVEVQEASAEQQVSLGRRSTLHQGP